MIQLLTHLFHEFQKDETSVMIGKSLFLGLITGITGTLENVDLFLGILLKAVSIISFVFAIIVAAPKVMEVIYKWKPFRKNDKDSI